ncbi:MAG: GntR family transcriptional regulator [Pseudolysinimonas sp.]
MAEVITDPAGDETEEASRLATSPVVTSVFEQILAAVHTGALLPGQRISDAALAERLGVSRTPVREALLRLREIGIVEASPSRFTRVADVTPVQTAQAFVVWHALYGALIDEVVPGASAELVPALELNHEEFLRGIDALDAQAIATANFLFFQRMHGESRNPALQRAITSVVHIVRLGSLHLPDYIDLAVLGKAQALLIEAVRGRDIDAAHIAMAILKRIDIPQP